MKSGSGEWGKIKRKADFFYRQRKVYKNNKSK
jgi:hypothetical protein